MSYIIEAVVRSNNFILRRLIGISIQIENFVLQREYGTL